MEFQSYTYFINWETQKERIKALHFSIDSSPEIPVSLLEYPQIESIQLEGAEYLGQAQTWEILSQLPALRRLSLKGNLPPDIPEALGKLPNLTEVSISSK